MYVHVITCVYVYIFAVSITIKNVLRSAYLQKKKTSKNKSKVRKIVRVMNEMKNVDHAGVGVGVRGSALF